MSTLQAKKPQHRVSSGFVTRNGTMRLVRSRYEGRKISLEDFLLWEPPMDGRKYEWNQGFIETNEKNMTTEQTFITENIAFAFEQTRYRKERHALLSEIDLEMPTLDKMRRPDMVYLTAEQIKAARSGVKPIPKFVIEVVSAHDKLNAMKAKLEDYFRFGVEVVWYVYPAHQHVEIYTSPTAILICNGEHLCSAAPALPEFSMKASDVFA
jgi:Uma2 family endonuclease